MYQILSICAIVAFFIPITIVILRKLWKENSLLLFACYWALGGIVNIIDILPFMSKRQIEVIGVVYNMLDGPFIFTIIYLTTVSRSIKRFVTIIAPLFVLSEISSLVINGLRYEALTWVLGVGVLLALIIFIWSLLWYLHKIEGDSLDTVDLIMEFEKELNISMPHEQAQTIYSYREKSMLFICASMLFSNGTFMVIYIFDYFVNKDGSRDNFLVYYISCIIAMLIASCGYLVKATAGEHTEDHLRSSPFNRPHYRY